MKESVRHLQWCDWTKLVTWAVSNTAWFVLKGTKNHQFKSGTVFHSRCLQAQPFKIPEFSILQLSFLHRVSFSLNFSHSLETWFYFLKLSLKLSNWCLSFLLPVLFVMHLFNTWNIISYTAHVLLLCVKSCLPPLHNYLEIDGMVPLR